MHVQGGTAGRRRRKTGWVIRPVRREQCAQPGHVCELVSALLCEGHTERICLVRSVEGGGGSKERVGGQKTRRRNGRAEQQGWCNPHSLFKPISTFLISSPTLAIAL